VAERFQEPVWLVRAVLVLFLVGFAAYLGRQVWLVFHG
jgi:phage shock protein PspC (stress-responsive transcriptional regulator)